LNKIISNKEKKLTTKSDEGKPFPIGSDERLWKKRQINRTDVYIVSGGTTTAYLLTKAGKRIIVVDDSAINGGEPPERRRICIGRD